MAQIKTILRSKNINFKARDKKEKLIELIIND